MDSINISEFDFKIILTLLLDLWFQSYITTFILKVAPSGNKVTIGGLGHSGLATQNITFNQSTKRLKDILSILYTCITDDLFIVDDGDGFYNILNQNLYNFPQ